jgi:hypothetical protein
MAAVALSACDSTDAIVAVNGVADTITITLAAPAIGQRIGAITELSLAVGDSATLQATALNALGFALGGLSFTWSTQAAGVASVSGQGLVRGVSPGATFVSASADGVGSSVLVSVTDTTSLPPAAPASGR